MHGSKQLAMSPDPGQIKPKLQWGAKATRSILAGGKVKSY